MGVMQASYSELEGVPEPVQVDADRSAYDTDRFWTQKRDTNRRVVRMLLQDTRWTSWIDLCCGQAPFFEDAPPGVRCVGVDRNPAQLVAARRHCPHAELVPMDVLDPAVVRLGRFGLVTMFWGAYSSLGSVEAVETLIDHMHALVAEGGAVYVEVVDPRRLGGFNDCAFARANNFKLEMIDEETGRWRYEDDEGEHELCSPPLSFFRSAFAKRDMSTRVFSVVQTLSQLVARRVASPGAYSFTRGSGRRTR